MSEGVSEGVSEEASFTDSDNNLGARIRAADLGVIQFRVHGLLDRLLMALKHLAEVITKMESRVPRGPSDYEENPRGIWINYDGTHGPAPTREPSWQGYLAKIVAILIASGLGSLVWVLSAMNSRLSTIEANQAGSNRLIMERLDQQERHLEAHDKQLDELNRETWSRRH